MPSQAGARADQLLRSSDVGDMAFQSAAGFVAKPQAVATPAMLGDMVFALTSNTTLVIKVRGLDGVVRSTTLTLT